MSQPTRVFVSLSQDEGAGRSAEDMHHIGVMALEKKGRVARNLYRTDLVARSGSFRNSREVSFEATLEPCDGGYTILPTTFRPGCEANFRVTVHADRKLGGSGDLARLSPDRDGVD